MTCLPLTEDQYRAQIRAKNNLRRKDERERVKLLNSPWKAPRLDFKRLAKIEKKLASNNKALVLEGMKDMLKLAQDHRDRCDAMRTTAEQQEAYAQAVARGEVIELQTHRKEHQNRIRITSRDGLEELHRTKKITDRQFQAGMRYRETYDRCDWERKLRPMDPGRIGSPHHGGEGYADKRAEWIKELTQVEALIVARTQNAYSLCTIQEMAGSRRSIRSMHGSGTYRAKQIEGLIKALDACVEHFGVK
jgi:hypothetical protein